jgi:hypothetical protein
LGNPDLKQELNHNIRLNGSFINPFKNRNLFVYFNYTLTQNKIVNYDKINLLGIDSVIPVNVNGVHNMNGRVSYGFPVHFLKGSLGISSTLDQYHGRQFLNSESNTINTTTVSPEVRLDMNPWEQLTLSLSAQYNYSKTKYSVYSARNAKYFIQEYDVDLGWRLPKGFFLATDFDYRINNQYSTGFNTKVPLWNASISKQMLHFNRGELKFSARDILNRNIGINRNASQNYIEDTRTSSLRRFFLLTCTYNITKTGLYNAGNSGRVMVR